jgi:2,3-bisphosphoglycerate-independent phosphoglycerate mutase
LAAEARRPAVLVILDGASEPLRGGEPTSLERAATPALDALCREGATLTRVRTVAPWLAPGSESAIPALLGWTPPSAVDRGAVEAAAWAVDGWERLGRACDERAAAGGLGAASANGAPGASGTASAPGTASANGTTSAPRERAWRVDVRAGDGSRADADAVADAVALLAGALPDHRVMPLAGHRLLVVGRGPLPVASAPPGHALHVWPAGVVPPRLLDARTVVVAARGAAAGIGRLTGARVVVPAGATGRPGSDLAAKGRAAVAEIEAGAARVVVHVGGADEAAHELDAEAKVAAIEAADRDVVGVLAAALVARGGGTLHICPDHGCDPRDGRHDAEPVPSLEWRPGGVGSPGAARLTERAVAGLAVVELARRLAGAAAADRGATPGGEPVRAAVTIEAAA